MVDYTQLTDEELQTEIEQANAANAELERRNRIAQASRTIAEILFQVERDEGDAVEVLVGAMGTTLLMLDPGGEHGPEGDTPVISDPEAQQIIEALQARIAGE